MFRKATKKQAKLRATFNGPAGSGKTFSSLELAKALGGRIALIDTEHGAAQHYADRFDFDAVNLEDQSIESYIKVIIAAGQAGYGVLIVDSLSHAWAGKGGALEVVDRVGGNNKFTNGWKVVTPLHNRLIDTLLAYPGHLICTMRTKTEWVLEKDEKGRTVPQKVGTAPVQRDGMEYEFDVVAEMDVRGNVIVTKTRCSLLSGLGGLLTHKEVPTMGATLKAWLSEGVAPEAATPPPAPPAQPASSSAQPAPAADFDVNATPAPGPAVAPPPTPEESEQKLLGLLQSAKSKMDLERLTPALRSLPGPVRDRLRPLWAKRLAEVTKKGGAHAAHG